ncbi:MAG: hypothetical protein HY874_09475 [Chloroflexi bacterium]|nr:hypothetical protein [Chloroflexota bacterium]
METTGLDTRAAAPMGELHARWRAAPQYHLANLASDPPAWREIPLDMLELLAFDQCLVFGATCSATAATIDGIARRDAVVRQTRDALWAIYRCVALRMQPPRRLALMREVAHAVERGTGSVASLLAFTACDSDRSVRAAAASRARALRALSQPEVPKAEVQPA